MKIMCWNVRGLGNPQGVKGLWNMLKSNIPQIVFLVETKISNQKMEGINRTCGFVHGIEVEADGSRSD